MNHQELELDEAVDLLAATARRLFPVVSAGQARELASLVLRDLRSRGIRLIRDREGA